MIDPELSKANKLDHLAKAAKARSARCHGWTLAVACSTTGCAWCQTRLHVKKP